MEVVGRCMQIISLLAMAMAHSYCAYYTTLRTVRSVQHGPRAQPGGLSGVYDYAALRISMRLLLIGVRYRFLKSRGQTSPSTSWTSCELPLGYVALI